MMFRLLVEKCLVPNPLTGRARYRVINCGECEIWFKSRKFTSHRQFVNPRLSILSDKEYKLGVYINPSRVIFGNANAKNV